MLFVSSFGYYFEELSYSEKMSLHKKTTTLLTAAMALLLLLPPLCSSQRVPAGLLGQPQQQRQQPFLPIAEFFCEWTPPAPLGGTQQQCVQAFTAFNVAPTVLNFCLSVGTFCTVQHLILCPRPATLLACRTCLPHFQRLCQPRQPPLPPRPLEQPPPPPQPQPQPAPQPQPQPQPQPPQPQQPVQG